MHRHLISSDVVHESNVELHDLFESKSLHFGTDNVAMNVSIPSRTCKSHLSLLACNVNGIAEKLKMRDFVSYACGFEIATMYLCRTCAQNP